MLSAHYKDDTFRHAHRKCYPALPPTMMSLGRVQYREMDADKLLYKSKQVFNKMIVTGEESNSLFHALYQTTVKFTSVVSTQEGSSNCIKLWCYMPYFFWNHHQSHWYKVFYNNIVLKTAAMQWGINMESVAKQAYVKSVKDKHELFEIEDAGLYIKPIVSHLGASTNGLISCSCCCLEVLETECPYSESVGDLSCLRNMTIITRFEVKWLSWNDLIVTLFAGPLLMYI